MSDIDFIKVNPTYVTDSLDLLPSQFLNSTNLRKLMAYRLTPHQEMQLLLVELAERHLLLSAEGVYLDNIGNKLGVPRTSADDDSYRNAILAATIGVRKNVTRDNIVELLQEVTGDDDVRVTIKPLFGVDINIFHGCFTDAESLRVIQNLFPIMANVVVSTRDGSAFGFGAASGNKGFGEGQLNNIVLAGD